MKTALKLLIFIISFIGTKSYAQDLNRKDLISWLKADNSPSFVINGIHFSYSDSLKLDNALKRIDKNKISDITILKNDGKYSPQTSDVIIIQYAIKLSKKVVEEKFTEIKPKFKDKYLGFSQHIYIDSKDPVLYLNGIKIHHTEINTFLNNLNAENIAYIYFSDKTQNPEYHGQNAINGIVIIWTNDKLLE